LSEKRSRTACADRRAHCLDGCHENLSKHASVGSICPSTEGRRTNGCSCEPCNSEASCKQPGVATSWRWLTCRLDLVTLHVATCCPGPCRLQALNQLQVQPANCHEVTQIVTNHRGEQRIRRVSVRCGLRVQLVHTGSTHSTPERLLLELPVCTMVRQREQDASHVSVSESA
jgi:hypothetical protein